MSGIHLRERNLIFVIKNLILVNIIEKSQKKLDLKAKGMGGGWGDVTKAEIKIMMPPKQLKPADIRNGRKASKRGRTLGSNLDFVPVGWETPPLSWVSQPQARGAKVIFSEDHLGASSDYSFCVPTQFRLKSRFLTFLLGRLKCAKLSGTGLSDAVQTELNKRVTCIG